jgi:uncharacterized protein
MKHLSYQYNQCVKDLMASNSVNSMSQFVQHGKVTCLEHCKYVSFNSYAICKFMGLDYRSAARGGLLHDYFLYDWHDSSPYRFHGLRHPKQALLNAKRDFELNATEVDIIKKHMWPLTLLPPRYLEAFIVGIVDKYCTISEVINSKK